MHGQQNVKKKKKSYLLSQSEWMSCNLHETLTEPCTYFINIYLISVTISHQSSIYKGSILWSQLLILTKAYIKCWMYMNSNEGFQHIKSENLFSTSISFCWKAFCYTYRKGNNFPVAKFIQISLWNWKAENILRVLTPYMIISCAS